MIDKTFEDFLLNNDLQRGDFKTTTNGDVRVVKEIYDDRFDVIYIKHFNKNGLKQNDYNVGGYYDKKERCIYDCDFWVKNLLTVKSEIRISSLYNLKNKIIDELSDYIKNYCFQHEKELNKIGIKELNSKDEWKISQYKKDVDRLFIAGDTDKLQVDTYFIRYSFEDTISYQYNGDLFIDYLNNPNEFISMCADKIIEKDKEKVGYEVSVYILKRDYLKKLEKNYHHEYDKVHISKNLYNALNLLQYEPKQVNITIQYNRNELSFKYDYISLKSRVMEGDNKCWGFGKNYEVVSDFIKANSRSEDNRYNTDFEISHIKSITYSRTELYRNDNIDKINKKKEINERNDR